jgi:hypothetical protein
MYSTSEQLERHDLSGKLLQSWALPQGAYFEGVLWPTGDDSTILMQSNVYGAYGYNYTLARFGYNSGRFVQLNTAPIQALSPDWTHALFSGNGSNSQSQYVVFLSGALGQNALTNLHYWNETAPYPNTGTWISNSSFAYFRYNWSEQLIDLVLRDTNLTKLDSFAITSYANLYYGSVFHAPGRFIFTGYFGILSLDSTTRQITQLATDDVNFSDIASDGSFLVWCNSNPQTLYVMNLKTGTRTQLAPNAGYLKLSPTNDHLAYIDYSDSRNYVLKVIPVSAP